MKVFISHKREDAATAAAIASHFRARSVEYYLDVIDTQLAMSGPDLADYIRNQMERCTQLLAVISSKTQSSWWVPWEIGVATEKERFLASFVAEYAAVPQYLLKWPYLRSLTELDIYIYESRRAETLVADRLAGGYRESARASGFRSFHDNLKAALRQ